MKDFLSFTFLITDIEANTKLWEKYPGTQKRPRPHVPYSTEEVGAIDRPVDDQAQKAFHFCDQDVLIALKTRLRDKNTLWGQVSRALNKKPRLSAQRRRYKTARDV